MTGPVHWFIGPDGMHIYRGGQLVAVVPVRAFAGVIADMAGVLASAQGRGVASKTPPERNRHRTGMSENLPDSVFSLAPDAGKI